jgi:methylated-DNA-protein-cysteine methyltransferase-like protein
MDLAKHGFSLVTFPRYQQIYDLVQQIPPGQVATYGQIADLLGLFGQARQVGYALHRLSPDSSVPWHRVVNAQGKISRSPHRLGSDDLQQMRLQQENIVFEQGERINLNRYRWQPSSPEAD